MLFLFERPRISFCAVLGVVSKRVLVNKIIMFSLGVITVISLNIHFRAQAMLEYYIMPEQYSSLVQMAVAAGEAGVITALVAVSTYSDGSVAIMDEILNRVQEVNRAHYASQALLAVAARGKAASVDILLRQGARVNTLGLNNVTPLIAAATRGKLVTVALLLDHGARINHQQHDGKTALELAADKGRKSVVQLLLDRGAECADPVMLKARAAWQDHQRRR